MNKNLRTIIILLLVLAICVGGFVLVMKLSDKKEAQDKADAEASVIEIGNIVDGLYIGITTNAGSMEFVSDGENWKYYQDEKFPLDESYMADIVDAAVGLTAIREIEISDDLEYYGLSEDAYLALRIIDSENNVFALDIGSPISDGSVWYAREPDKDTIYIIDSELPNAVDFQIFDIMEMEEFGSFDAADILNISVTGRKAQLAYMQETVTSELATGEIDEDTGEQVYNENIISTWYDITGEDPVKLTDITTPSILAEAAASFEFVSCIDYDASEEYLEACGFTDPNFTITVTWTDIGGEEVTQTMIVGRLDGNGNYWAKLADSNAAYLISESAILPFKNVLESISE